jgi:hypothetical protein
MHLLPLALAGTALRWRETVNRPVTTASCREVSASLDGTCAELDKCDGLMDNTAAAGALDTTITRGVRTGAHWDTSNLDAIMSHMSCNMLIAHWDTSKLDAIMSHMSCNMLIAHWDTSNLDAIMSHIMSCNMLIEAGPSCSHNCRHLRRRNYDSTHLSVLLLCHVPSCQHVICSMQIAVETRIICCDHALSCMALSTMSALYDGASTSAAAAKFTVLPVRVT